MMAGRVDLSGTTVARANWRKLFAVRGFMALAREQAKLAPAQILIDGRYRVGKKIANGAFGQLRIGWSVTEFDVRATSASVNADFDDESPNCVAIKVEPVNAVIPMLPLEFRFYKALGPHPGLPQILHFGPCGNKYNALVMEMLGPNLEQLFVTCKRRFSLQTILIIALQLLDRLEFVHSKGIVYRDVKPENCCVGRPGCGRSDRIYLVDFGLAKEYLDPVTGLHKPFTEERCLTGTVRYMSLNAHKGREQSRRDDLEALGHVLFYFLTGGRLPWQGCKGNGDQSAEGDLKGKYQVIGRVKEETRLSDLGDGHPWEFSIYLRYCRNLRFNEDPDYGYLRSLFTGCLSRHSLEEDNINLDWVSSKSGVQAEGGERGVDSNGRRETQDNSAKTRRQQREMLERQSDTAAAATPVPVIAAAPVVSNRRMPNVLDVNDGDEKKRQKNPQHRRQIMFVRPAPSTSTSTIQKEEKKLANPRGKTREDLARLDRAFEQKLELSYYARSPTARRPVATVEPMVLERVATRQQLVVQPGSGATNGDSTEGKQQQFKHPDRCYQPEVVQFDSCCVLARAITCFSTTV